MVNAFSDSLNEYYSEMDADMWISPKPFTVADIPEYLSKESIQDMNLEELTCAVKCAEDAIHKIPARFMLQGLECIKAQHWDAIYDFLMSRKKELGLDVGSWREQCDRKAFRELSKKMKEERQLAKLQKLMNENPEDDALAVKEDKSALLDTLKIPKNERVIAEAIMEMDVNHITDYDIGTLMVLVMKTLYADSPIKCTTIKKDIYSCKFMQFDKTIWREVKNGIDLLDKLISHVVPVFVRLSNLDVPPPQKKRYLSLADTVKNHRHNILVAFAEQVFDSTFFDDINNCFTLLPFNDVVLDLETKKLIPGNPDHRFTKTTGYDFPKNVTADQVMMATEFIKKIFPTQNVLDYMLENIAYCLSGLTRPETFHIMVGTGSNGKTVLDNLMECVLGDFYKTLNPIRLCQELESAKNADPELLEYNGARFISCGEPSAGKPIVCATLKKFTSEKLGARPLFGNDIIYFKVQGKIFIMSNVLPKLDNSDYATKRRACVCIMESEFVSDPKKVNEAENKYLKDMAIKERMHELRDAFVHLLIERFNINLRDDNRPPAIEEASNAYLDENDVTGIFFTENILESEDKDDFILPGALHKYYINWMKCHHPKKTPIGMQMFNKHISKHFTDLGLPNPIKDKHNYYKIENGHRKRTSAKNVIVGYHCPKLNKQDEHH